jgi:hypothetical protein
VALDRLAKANGEGDNRVIVITDGQSAVADVEQVAEIASSMRDMRVKLDVLSIGFDLSSLERVHSDVASVLAAMAEGLGESFRCLNIATAIEILLQARKPPVLQR